MKVTVALLILNLCTGWSIRLHVPITFHPAKEAPNTQCVWGWVSTRVSQYDLEKRKMTCPCQELTHDSLVIQSVTIVTTPEENHTLNFVKTLHNTLLQRFRSIWRERQWQSKRFHYNFFTLLPATFGSCTARISQL